MVCNWLRREVAQSCPTLHDPMGYSPPSMEFCRKEYWSGLPFPSPGNLPTQGLNPGLSHCKQTLYCLSHQGIWLAYSHSNAFFFFTSSFDSKFVYQQRGLGPIEEDTILVIDPNNAAVLQSSGKNLWVTLHMLLLMLVLFGTKYIIGSSLRKSILCSSGEKTQLKKAGDW